eukprot:90176-Alexandrium_andersonii.AAC.1
MAPPLAKGTASGGGTGLAQRAGVRTTRRWQRGRVAHGEDQGAHSVSERPRPEREAVAGRRHGM